MGLKAASRVRETSTTTGTGSYTLAGAATGFRSFSSGIGTGNTLHYCATDGTGWEVALGTLSGATTLARTTILASSNGGSAVNWTAGTRTIICTMPGEAMIPGALKLGSFTRDLTAAAGTQAITGVGFKPRVVTLFGGFPGSSAAASWGIDDGTTARFSIGNYHATNANTFIGESGNSILAVTGASALQSAVIASMDADGFSLTWSKVGAPSGTFKVCYCAEA